MHEFTEVEANILVAMLRSKGQFFKTYNYVKGKSKNQEHIRKRIWICIRNLEDLSLIERVTDAKTRKIIHKINFNRDLLKENYNIDFIDEIESEFKQVKEKKSISIQDLSEIFKIQKQTILNKYENIENII